MPRYLTSYISRQTDERAVYQVDIKQEVENFKRNHPYSPKPIVIFDFNGTIRMLVHDSKETMYAGRHNEFIRRAESFLQKFQDLGVDLVFYLEGPVKEIKLPELMLRKNQEYDEQSKLFRNFKAGELIHYEFSKYLKTYHENYVRVAKKYGRVFIALENECDLDLAAYATSVNALAVIAEDSDMLIMPGDWPIWVSSTLNVQHMTVNAWDKKKLRDSLGLQQWQMPILAALSGCSWIEFKHVQHLRWQFFGNLVEVQKALARFIKNKFQTQQNISSKIVELIYMDGCCELSRGEIERLVKITLDNYDYTTHNITRVEPEWLRDHVNETASGHVYAIYKRFTMKVTHAFVDVSMNAKSSFAEVVLPIILRQVGIMFPRVSYRDLKFKLCLKTNNIERFCIKEYAPIYPDIEVPKIEDILSNDEDAISLERRAEILSLVVSPKSQKTSVKKILELLKTIFIVPALILNFLVQENEITADEADILLMTISGAYKLDPKEAEMMRPSERVYEKPFWLSHFYTNLVSYFEDAMVFCGLHKYVPNSYFDGYLFHTMYKKFTGMTSDEKLEVKESLREYRLYE